MDSPRFSLVIPCYNEEASLPELVRRAEFTAREGRGEIILVDNGSTDNSPAVLHELINATVANWVKSVRVPANQGYGFGILAGLEIAAAPYVGWTHADLQTDPADVLRIIDTIESTGPHSFAKGRRYGRPFADRFFTTGMSIFESLLLGMKLSDINAQPTIFGRALLDQWDDPPSDFSLDLYAFYTARKSGFRVLRFPVVFAPRRFGTSSWNIDLSAKRRFIDRTLRFSLALRRSLRGRTKPC